VVSATTLIHRVLFPTISTLDPSTFVEPLANALVLVAIGANEAMIRKTVIIKHWNLPSLLD
jgi:multisubunit Na+/H+ antiporter MnhC subunit